MITALALALSAGATACNRRTAPFTDEEPTGASGPVRIPMLATPRPDVGTMRPGPTATAPQRASTSASGASITGTIRLAPGTVVPPARTLFVYAYAADGSAGPPFAAKSLPPDAFPMSFSLGPEDVLPMSGRRSFEGPMTILARLDMDGNASTKSPEDLVGAAPGAIEPGATGLEILLGAAGR